MIIELYNRIEPICYKLFIKCQNYGSYIMKLLLYRLDLS